MRRGQPVLPSTSGSSAWLDQAPCGASEAYILADTTDHRLILYLDVRDDQVVGAFAVAATTASAPPAAASAPRRPPSGKKSPVPACKP